MLWSSSDFSILHAAAMLLGRLEASGMNGLAWKILLLFCGKIHMTVICPQKSFILDFVGPNWNYFTWNPFLHRKVTPLRIQIDFVLSYMCINELPLEDEIPTLVLRVESSKIILYLTMSHRKAFLPHSVFSFLEFTRCWVRSVFSFWKATCVTVVLTRVSGVGCSEWNC